MTGGGTGGHIYPALAIADKFVEKDPGTEVLYIGDKNCMESTIVPGAGYEFRDVFRGLRFMRVFGHIFSAHHVFRESYPVSPDYPGAS